MSELSYQLRKEVKEYNSGFFKGDLNKIRELIKRGANVNDIDEYDRTALHIACFDEKHVPDLDLIETLIRCGGRLDVVNRYGENCLHLICQNHYKDELVELLLDCGTDPNQKDFHGNTPLHVLVENPKQDVSFNTLKLFTKKGADVYALNKLNKNIFVYLEPQMNEDLQFYAKRCLVKLNRLKRLLGIQQQQFPGESIPGETIPGGNIASNQNVTSSQNISLQDNIPQPIKSVDLPKGSNVNASPIPNITPPTNTFANVPVSNAPISTSNAPIPGQGAPTEPIFANVPVTPTENWTQGMQNLSIDPNQQQRWNDPNNPYNYKQAFPGQSGQNLPGQQNIPVQTRQVVIEENPK
jgi:hypothetical protein